MTATTTGTGARRIEEIANPSQIAPKDARELTRHFLGRLAELEEGTPEHQYARNTLIEMNISLVRYAASRFRSRGPEEMEDIVQVGTIGLIKAIDRFEVSREVEFTSFSIPYIVGEIKRFFRDTSWAVHVPRRLQEARVQLARATEELSTRLGRTPTVAELSQLMSLTEDEVVEARLASNGYNSSSLDAAISAGDDGESVLADFIGCEDGALELVEDFHALAPLLAELDERERLIIHLRFVEERTQAEIGARLGVSQMHVSRLLSRLLARLREGLLATG
ncbi:MULTISPECIES: SigB/SigF/SigG family RNA polymerase sigma factor [Streptomyces]|jgi:RNA polymerase sigma-B factor|uniref:SigB/SigF/SigG family RNA polymerase sigma factor n=1 Tax=Streptomyces doudnae TaxID=3075536 RepID=A0ABD5EYE2_9ACTN|nr:MULTISPECIES: SigB/SigF/SigG family RNA polymerase sigma factor [unclassified Streptomyces]MDT0439197.1 SigB/SigF/SigG family RNA polymerase sigma factor [Streptomyces sp. DSM 41981]MYQ65781.1 SigB/SigF/SigG family RNA polymerase sigma factor [Streptomyces sp. SID4950]SCE07621.1 RNA polymerase sigma-B factor [Streptomyces sp. SolWspMP-5a-2]